jgi:hypothetical protein
MSKPTQITDSTELHQTIGSAPSKVDLHTLCRVAPPVYDKPGPQLAPLDSPLDL